MTSSTASRATTSQRLGAGDDVFQWDPGDGSDVVEGQDGTDSMLFNGSAGGEIFAASANGGRVLFTRNLGNIVMDLDDVESIDLNALAGTDTLTVNDLSGTDVVEGQRRSRRHHRRHRGDGEADTVIANATNGDDTIDVVGAGTAVSVNGLAARINVTNSEGANDALVINGQGGDDTITATTLPAGVVKLTIDGGAGDDTIFGSQAADTFLGGDGDDFIFGDNGNDVAFMGAGDDTFQWDPGDGNDTVEGQDGFDTMLFLGAGASENVDIVANGGRVLFNRSPGNVVMDLNDVERIDFRALGGADNIVINDLSGTDVTQIDLDLRGPNGGGDGAADTVTVKRHQRRRHHQRRGRRRRRQRVRPVGRSEHRLPGAGQRPADDQCGRRRRRHQCEQPGSGRHPAHDERRSRRRPVHRQRRRRPHQRRRRRRRSAHGRGDDTFVWNPGDDNDTIEGQDGFDTMLFNGAGASENVSIFANGGRALFFRDVANVTMDMNDVEQVVFNALGGADSIVVEDLSGTDLTEIDINLGSTIGGTAGDGAGRHRHGERHEWRRCLDRGGRRFRRVRARSGCPDQRYRR